MGQAALIGLDWGTSSFRAYRLSADGQILSRREAPAGILQVPERRFEDALWNQIDAWVRAEPQLPLLASGMIGSRQGWVETPYVSCPAGTDELVGAIATHRTQRGPMIRFVPGLSLRGAGGIPDVIRGEETQVLGVLSDGPATGTLVLPGTHSKWVRVDDARITWFATFMTGELFAVLRQHSILGRLMEDHGEDLAAFDRGVGLGLSGDAGAGGLLRRLFSARTLGLFDEIAPTGISDYLSGLLLGAEIREALGCLGDGTRDGLVIVGGVALADRYRRALTIAGVGCEPFTGEAAAIGQLTIARAAGLLG